MARDVFHVPSTIRKCVGPPAVGSCAWHNGAVPRHEISPQKHSTLWPVQVAEYALRPPSERGGAVPSSLRRSRSRVLTCSVLLAEPGGAPWEAQGSAMEAAV